MFNTEQLTLLFKAGIATITIDTPAASEPALVEKIIIDLQERYRTIFQWDCGNQFLQLTPIVERNAIARIDKTPASGVNPEAHPIITFVKHLERLIDEETNPTLIIAKDFLEFVGKPGSRPDWIRLSQDLFFAIKRSPHRLVLTHQGLDIPSNFKDLVWEMANSLPDEREVEQIKQRKLTALSASATTNQINFELTLNDQEQQQLTRALQGMTVEGIEDALQLVAIQQRGINCHTIKQIIDIKKQHLAAKGITFAPPPDVPIQGLPAVTQWAEKQQPLLDVEKRSEHNLDKPASVLFLGVAGTGKSLAVKAIASLWQVPCLSLDMGRLMSKELGSSEANLRTILQQAEALSPCVLWIDEIDKQISQKSSESDGGTSARMVGTLLTWLEENKADVIVAATANRSWGFSKEMLRRFKVFYVDLPSTQTRAEIWKVQLEHYLIQLESEFIQLLAKRSVAYTGAEIRNIVKESATEAFANGHPRLVSSDRLLTLLDLKPPQFRHDTEELEALRKWAASGGAEFAAPPDFSNTPQVTSDSNSLREVSWY
jgi:predicted AAA+ superfamily ATPase